MSPEDLRFQKFPDLLGNDAVGRVDAAFKAAIYFCQFSVLNKNRNHTAFVDGAAVAAEETLNFHLQILHHAEAHGTDAEPIGRYGLQLVGVQQSAGRHFPIIAAAVYINPNLFVVQTTAETQKLVF